jgi:hypothetical protein
VGVAALGGVYFQQGEPDGFRSVVLAVADVMALTVFAALRAGRERSLAEVP